MVQPEALVALAAQEQHYLLRARTLQNSVNNASDIPTLRAYRNLHLGTLGQMGF